MRTGSSLGVAAAHCPGPASTMGRASRRWLVALCSTSAVLILFWLGSEGRNSWEPVQFRVTKDIFVDSGSDNHKDAAAGNNNRDLGKPNSSGLGLPSNQLFEGQSHGLEGDKGNSRRARVLLTSYMRSGSTFTGDIFQAMPGVFYLYEPLLYVNDDDYMLPGARPAKSRLIPNAMGIPNPPEIHNYTLDTLNCKLSDHNLRFLYGLTYSKSTAEFDQCKKGLGVKPSAFGKCGEKLRTRCEQSEAVVSKILRLKMWEVERLLAQDPDLRVIHLVRDPRGVYVSRRTVGYYFGESPFCARLNADSRKSIELQVKYPDRILTTRYEDLATDAPQVAKIMFDFAGIRWSKEVEATLSNMTSNSDVNTTENVFNTRRKNSSLTAFSWRQKIPFKTAEKLQSLCQPAMGVYGYVPFNSLQDLRDLNIASFQRHYSDQFYKAQVLR